MSRAVAAGLVAALGLVGVACEGGSGPAPQAHAAGLASGVVPAESFPGDLALDYVGGERYPALVVEVDYVEGARPAGDALYALKEALERRLRKPAGVEIRLPRPEEVIPADLTPDAWADADIKGLEAAFRAHRTADPGEPFRAAIWVVYLPGRSIYEDATTDALGLAVGGSQIAVFPGRIDSAMGAPALDPEARTAAEACVLLHEVGHLLGLVNNGIPQVGDHEDPLHPYHDPDPTCVMHYRIEQGWLGAQALPDFCVACREDLFAIGGPDPGVQAAVIPIKDAGRGGAEQPIAAGLPAR